MSFELPSTDIYGIRLLVFMETEPQSNRYRQVLLSPEEFKKVSLSIGKNTGKKVEGSDLDEVNIQMWEEEYDLPDLREMET